MISHSSFAASICSDLAAHTCAPGEKHDGTGTTKLAEPLAFMNQEFDRIRPRLAADFTKLISDSPDLRGLAIKAYGFNNEEACKSTSRSSNCIGLIVDRLIESYKLIEFKGLLMNSASFFTGDSFATNKLLEDAKYQKVVSRIAAEQVKLVPKSLLERVEKVMFPQVKSLLVARIRSLSIDETTRSQIIKKLEAVDFEIGDCYTQSKEISISPAFAPDAFYEPNRNSFYICLGFFKASDSEFNIAYIMAHELAHSLDPCQITDGENTAPIAQRKSDPEVDDTYLKKNFLKCLRSEDSVAAKRTGPDFVPFPSGAADYRVYNDTARLCARDNLNEAVPDWFAAEVIGEYAEKYLPNLSKEQKAAGFSNILRATCNETIAPGAQHLPSNSRINGILLVQPKIRQQMGCAAEAPKRYCDIDDPSSLLEKPKKEKPQKRGPEKSKNKAVK